MSIFKDCDIRGVYGAELTDADAYSIGRGLATMIPAGGTVRVGGDARLSTPALKEALLRGMEEKTGCIARSRAVQQALTTIEAAATALLRQPQSAALAQEILSAAAAIKE